MKRDNNKLFIIFALILAVTVMSVGYAALANQLTITGTSGTGNASWNISFLSITKNASLSTSSAAEVNAPTASGLAATFDVTVSEPGATIVYDIIVQNTGTIDATLSAITGLLEINQAEPTAITYTFNRLNPVTDEVVGNTGDLLHGATNKFRLTITWPATSTSVPTGTTSKSGTIYLDYVQKTS